MPILRPEPTIFPESLLDEEERSDDARRWRVLYTKSRQEKALARDLLAATVPFYLPLIAKENVMRGRRIASYIPLFTGYMFLFGDEDERLRTLQTNRISRVLDVEDVGSLVHDLRQIQHLIASGAPLTVESRLEPGNRVRVKHGSFAGLEGTVLQRRGKTRLLVAVNFLQQGASVEVEDFFLEPI
ncbi:MAG: transcription termination/antitermination NusG family protein, partial [Patescibacteria group bacterium]|nr:transcription termination/antitermination NusG family protein [Patescibacteria group bacterium]